MGSLGSKLQAVNILHFLAFADESDLTKYIPKPKYKQLPNTLRITSMDRIILYMKKNALSQGVELAHCMIVIAFLLLYVFNLYSTNLAIIIIDLIISFAYITFMLLNFALSERKRAYIFYPHVILDVITVLPITVIIIIDLVQLMVSNPSALLIVHPAVRFVRLFRIGAVFNTYYEHRERGVIATVFILLASMFTLIVIFSALIMIIENDIFQEDQSIRVANTVLEFHYAAYMVFITILTIGYGDQSPKSVVGQFAMCFFSVVGALILLGKGKEILSILQNEGEVLFNRVKIGDVTDHIIIAGHSSAIEIFEFMKEFLNESHGKVNAKRIVVVIPKSSSENYQVLKQLTNHKFFKERVLIINDDISNFQLLKRLRTSHAHGIFILSNSSTNDPEQQDLKTLMIVLGIRNYSPHAKIYVQYILEKNSPTFATVGVMNSLCIDDLKLKLLSNSVMCQGLTTLVSNVIVSASANEVIKAFSSKRFTWIKEYCEGCENEIYVVDFSPSFTGVEFIKAVEYVYEHYDLVLIGIQHATYGLLMNPGLKHSPYVISEHDRGVVMGQSAFHAHVMRLCRVPDALRHLGPDGELRSSSQMSSSSIRQTKSLDDTFFHLRPPGSLMDEFYQQDDLSVTTAEKDSDEEIKSDTSRWRDALSLVRRSNNLNFVLKAKSRSTYRLKTPQQKDQFEITHCFDLTNHVLLMGHNYSSAIAMAENLRSRYIPQGHLRPVVIMVSDPNKHIPLSLSDKFDDYEFSQEYHELIDYLYLHLRFLSDVYVMYGTAIEYKDMERANIQNCSAGVFVAPTQKAEKQKSELVDSKAIKTALVFSSFSNSKPFIADIMFRRNIQYFSSQRDFVDDVDEEYTGFNPFTYLKNIFSGKQVDSDFETYCLTSKLFAQGKIFSRSFFTRLLCQTYFTPEIIEVIENFCGYSRQTEVPTYHLRAPEMAVHQLPVTETIVGEEFRDVYLHFLNFRGIVIGMYRFENDEFKYVVCNAPTATLIRKNDHLFVIGNYSDIKSASSVYKRKVHSHYTNLFEPDTTPLDTRNSSIYSPPSSRTGSVYRPSSHPSSTVHPA